MADPITIEEFHLTVLVPPGLPERQTEAIRRTLDGRRFQARLLSAARRVCRRYPALRKVGCGCRGERHVHTCSEPQRRPFVSAKHKLNSANLLGIVLIAGLAGGITGSWAVFWITGVALFLTAVHSGDIRR